jgi:hypothetical protein
MLKRVLSLIEKTLSTNGLSPKQSFTKADKRALKFDRWKTEVL